MEIWGLFLYLHASKSARVGYSVIPFAEASTKMPSALRRGLCLTGSFISSSQNWAGFRRPLLKPQLSSRGCSGDCSTAPRPPPSEPAGQLHHYINAFKSHQSTKPQCKSCLCLGQGGWKPVRTKRRLHLCQFSGIIEVQRRGICWTPLSFQQERASFVRLHKKSSSLKQAIFIKTRRRIYRLTHMLAPFREAGEEAGAGRGWSISGWLLIKAPRSSGWYQSRQHVQACARLLMTPSLPGLPTGITAINNCWFAQNEQIRRKVIVWGGTTEQ